MLLHTTGDGSAASIIC